MRKELGKFLRAAKFVRTVLSNVRASNVRSEHDVVYLVYQNSTSNFIAAAFATKRTNLQERVPLPITKWCTKWIDLGGKNVPQVIARTLYGEG